MTPPCDRITKHIMQSMQIDVLSALAARLTEGSSVTPAERAELLRIAQGFAGKDSAAAADLSPETIRARRKRIYRKLELSGANEVISAVLALSLRALARPQPAPSPDVVEEATVAQV